MLLLCEPLDEPIIDKEDNLKINCYVIEDTVTAQTGVLNCVQIMNLLLGSYISSASYRKCQRKH